MNRFPTTTFHQLRPGDRILHPGWPTNPFTVRKTKHVLKPWSFGKDKPLHQRGIQQEWTVYGVFDRPEEIKWYGARRDRIHVTDTEVLIALPEKR